MNSPTKEAGSFDKVYFESVIDTVAGGGTLDVTGYTNADGLITGGLPVGPKSATTGLHPIVIVVTGALNGPVLGYTKKDSRLTPGGNNTVSIVLEGVLRQATIPAAYSTVIAGLKSATPKVTIL